MKDKFDWMNDWVEIVVKEYEKCSRRSRKSNRTQLGTCVFLWKTTYKTETRQLPSSFMNVGINQQFRGEASELGTLVFFNLFNNKQLFLAFFYQVNLTGSGFFNRTGAEIGCYLDQKCKNPRYRKYPALAEAQSIVLWPHLLLCVMKEIDVRHNCNNSCCLSIRHISGWPQLFKMHTFLLKNLSVGQETASWVETWMLLTFPFNFFKIATPRCWLVTSYLTHIFAFPKRTKLTFLCDESAKFQTLHGEIFDFRPSHTPAPADFGDLLSGGNRLLSSCWRGNLL